MDDIGLGHAILMALLIYSGVSFALTALGSFGLYKLLSAKKNPGAGWIATGAAVLILLLAFLGGPQHGGELLVGMLCYAVFGLTAWLTNRTPAAPPPPNNG